MATLTERVSALESSLSVIAEGVAALVAAQATPRAKAKAESTFATKADREAGHGFSCTCGRNDLRVAPKAGKSFHKAPDGTIHDLR